MTLSVQKRSIASLALLGSAVPVAGAMVNAGSADAAATAPSSQLWQRFNTADYEAIATPDKDTSPYNTWKVGSGDTWASAFTDSKGDVFYCALDPNDGPEQDGKAHTYTGTTDVSGPYKAGMGGYADARTTAEVAYIVNRYGQPDASESAEQKAIQATAVDYLQGQFYGHGVKGGIKWHDIQPDMPDYSKIEALVQQYSTEASNYVSSDGTGKFTMNTPTLSGTDSITVSNIGVKAPSGKAVTNMPVTLTITGPGTFSNGSKTMTTTDATAAITRSGAGQITVSASSSAVPDENLVQATPSAADAVQKLWIAGSQHALSAQAQTGSTPSTPTVTTQTSSQSANVGDTITDTINGSGFPAGAKVTGTDKLTDASGKVVTTVDWSATAGSDGSFSTKTEGYKVTTPGTYTWVESSNAGGTGDNTFPATTGKPGDTAETTVVKTPTNTPTENTPTITTQTSSQTANVGDKIYDTVNGSGFPAGAKVTGSDKLVDASGKTVTTVQWSATADNNGSFSTKTPTYTVTTPGTYTWVESSNAGGTGDNTFPATTGKPGDTAETTTVTKPGTPTVQPVVTTQTSNAQVNGPTSISDTIKVTGGVPGSTVTGTDVLYGPLTSKPAEGAVPAGSPVAGTVKWTATLDKNGNATVKSPSVMVSKPGYYAWNESLNGGTYNGKTWQPSKDTFGKTPETTYYSKPGTPVVNKPVNGPTVQTDHGSSSSAEGFGGLAALAVLGGAGVLVAARRKMSNN